MFERFTDQARLVMALANEEAQRQNHEFLGTEHILMGLVKNDLCVGAKVLKNLGVDLAKVVIEVEKLATPRLETTTTGKLPKTARARNVIAGAIDESQVLEHGYVGTEHLLLGLMYEPEAIAGKVLASFKLDIDVLREEVLRFLETEEREVGTL